MRHLFVNKFMKKQNDRNTISSMLFCIPGLILSIFFLVVLASYEIPLVAYADSDDTMTLVAESKTDDDGYSYDCDVEYAVLNNDYTGMVVVDECAYTIEWSYDDGKLTWTDHMGEKFYGTLDGNQEITGEYRDRIYTYIVSDEDAKIISLAPDRWNIGLDYVTDQADILTDDEESQLRANADKISQEYGCMVYIVTLDDMRNFTQGDSIERTAEEIRAGYDLGYGSEHNLIMLVLSMAERDYDLMAFGDFANTSFTDYGKNHMEDKFLDDFADNEWYNGFTDYIFQCDKLLKLSSEGKPLDVGTSPAYIGVSVLASVIIGFIVALIICCIIKGTMRKTSEKSDASSYVLQNGVHIVHSQDLFMRTSETRVYDPPQSSDSDSGGGGTTVSSSGSSHSSGKF